MSKSVMGQIIERFKPVDRWRIDHKRLWLQYLKTGILPFSPKELHGAIRGNVKALDNKCIDCYSVKILK